MVGQADGQNVARRAAFVYSRDFEKYEYPLQCPFRTCRAGKARRILAGMGLLAGPDRRELVPSPASREAMETIHAPRYLDVLAQASRGKLELEGLNMGLGTPDCPVWLGLYDYASLACGASLKGAELILAGQADVAFNPSGGYHHAHHAEAAGFCYINDVAIACMRLADAGKRALYLDIDVHHGDGVQEAFYDRADVMTISFHQDGRTLFPGTGSADETGFGPGAGYAVNVPLPVGTHDEAYLRAFREIAPPLIGAFGPDVIVMEIGMDALAGDPLAQLELTNNTHEQVIRDVMDFKKPVLAIGGGGYNVDNTARGWALAWTVLCGLDEGRDDMNAGLGGVMMETTDWPGGLRDRRRAQNATIRAQVDATVDATIEKVKANVFPAHGL